MKKKCRFISGLVLAVSLLVYFPVYALGFGFTGFFGETLEGNSFSFNYAFVPFGDLGVHAQDSHGLQVLKNKERK